MNTPAPGPADRPLDDLRGVVDPGMNNLVAFALRVPPGWQLQQSFTRYWNGTVPYTQIYLCLAAPDGRSRIEFLPEMLYSFCNSPAAQWTQQMMAQQGQHDPGFLAPLLPLDYLRRVLLPLLAQRGNLHVQPTAGNALPPTPTGPNTQAATGYLDGVLASGRKVRVNTALSVMSGPAMGYLLQSWSAQNRVVQSDDDLAACVALADAAERSVQINPAWHAQDQALRQRGMQMDQQQAQANLQATVRQGQANLEASRQRFEANRDLQEHRREAINHNFARRQHANDQAAAAFCDYLGDRTLYQNPDTGERVRVQGHFDHVYQESTVGTTFLGTNTPLDAPRVDWQELQRVELRNY